MKWGARMIRCLNIFALLLGWAVLAFGLLGVAGRGNFVLYYGFEKVILITCDGCAEKGEASRSQPNEQAPVDL